MYLKIARTSIIMIMALFLSHYTSFAAPDGKALFQSNCAACHNPLKDATGPALKGVDTRVPSKKWLHDWVKNSSGLVASGDKAAVEVFNKWNKIPMPGFAALSDEDIDAIITYVNSVEAPKAPSAAPAAGGAPETSDNTWLYTFVTIALLIVLIILWRANQGLRRIANDAEGVPNVKEVPFYRNKVFIAIGVIVMFICSGYWFTNGAIEIGRQQNYEPEQPIFYSHKVHAGINQINCQYCHSSADKGKMAMVPSPNVCMNCHKQISEYTGEEKLVTAEGKEIDGTAEIKKLYEHTGWDPAKKDYKRDANGNIITKPIEWVKVHNLPDHVYFNHSQHVVAGKVQCQRCHGPVEEMHEVYQFAPLSMGWCVNCHRQTEVQFANNNYYSIFEKYHEEIKSGKRKGVTVEDIGGLECQKCHY